MASVFLAVAFLACTGVLRANTMPMVTVGNPGNVADSAYDSGTGTSTSPGTGQGSVGYTYQIATYDVTLTQYTAFLNSVAATDTYGLYNVSMGTDGNVLGISRSGSSGSYTYAVLGDGQRPVTYVSWYDAVRYTNWLTDGNTESGAYTISGGSNNGGTVTVPSTAQRAAWAAGGSGTYYYLPDENEWYKAAYYKSGGTNAGYWAYPMKTNVAPTNNLVGSGSNSANFYNSAGYATTQLSSYSSTQNYLTDVGAYSGSPGPYGTFDMGGDVDQWNDLNPDVVSSSRGLRASGWGDFGSGVLASSNRDTIDPTVEFSSVGFRVASVPEPGSLALLFAGAVGLLAFAWRRKNVSQLICVMVFLVSSASLAQADVFNMGGTISGGTWTGLASLSFVTVGDPGNLPDTVVEEDGTTGYGAVPYTFEMGTYDVTVAQYTAFLNAVATKSDPYGLYNSNMPTNLPTIHIARSGSAPHYSYSVTGSDAQAGNCPIFDVTWGDAARFCNWLQNGQPTSGTEAAGTTERGAYTLNGDVTTLTETRSANATYFIPSDNEWYKAAYYDPALNGGAGGYWAYPTKSNIAPIASLVLASTSPNDANWQYLSVNTDPTNILTPVGTFAASPGPFGTYDMGGDVWQWNDTVISGSYRATRGAASDIGIASYLSSSNRGIQTPSVLNFSFGFRVASSAAVPEPGSLALLLAGAVGLLAFAWRRKHARQLICMMVLLVSSTELANADVFNLGGSNANLTFVTVGDPGNVADPATGGLYGAVAYNYDIGKYDVTLAQYAAMLNAVAATDTYGLYNSNMVNGGNAGGTGYTSGISRTGVSGSFSYAIVGNGNMPVYAETWGDAARFCNWLQNGQPSGAEGLGTTESGAYYLNGALNQTQLMNVASPSHSGSNAAEFFLPTENEWYKAAYYVGGGTSAGYWAYPTQSSVPPNNSLVLATSTSNEANFYDGIYTDPTNFLTGVGTFSASPGPYGTYDMGGDLDQWNETAVSSSTRGVRGGYWNGSSSLLDRADRNGFDPTDGDILVSFRVASSVVVPEPGSLALSLAAAVGLLAFAWQRKNGRKLICMMVLLVSSTGLARADVFNMGGTISGGTWTGLASLSFVPVGNPGNIADSAYDSGTGTSTSPGTGYGSVPYTYKMGEYDVTVGQYCQFLNAVAKTDTYGLYNIGMDEDLQTVELSRDGYPGSFTYGVSGADSQAANCPIIGVSWGDAARFCNWLQNGQPTSGTEGAGTTETGAYTLNGATSTALLMSTTRNAGATYYIPSQNEWYKAAYYVGGGTNAGYWTYPTKSNTVPSNVLSPSGTNNANYAVAYGSGPYTDGLNLVTPVGSFANSPGPYGTFDMGGEVFEWNEAVYEGSGRGDDGGSYDFPAMQMSSAIQANTDPAIGPYDGGFRVASAAVPEPGSISLLLACAGAFGIWRLRRKA